MAACTSGSFTSGFGSVHQCPAARVPIATKASGAAYGKDSPFEPIGCAIVLTHRPPTTYGGQPAEIEWKKTPHLLEQSNLGSVVAPCAERPRSVAKRLQGFGRNVRRGLRTALKFP